MLYKNGFFKASLLTLTLVLGASFSGTSFAAKNLPSPSSCLAPLDQQIEPNFQTIPKISFIEKVRGVFSPSLVEKKAIKTFTQRIFSNQSNPALDHARINHELRTSGELSAGQAKYVRNLLLGLRKIPNDPYGEFRTYRRDIMNGEALPEGFIASLKVDALYTDLGFMSVWATPRYTWPARIRFEIKGKTAKDIGWEFGDLFTDHNEAVFLPGTVFRITGVATVDGWSDNTQTETHPFLRVQMEEVAPSPYL